MLDTEEELVRNLRGQADRGLEPEAQARTEAAVTQHLRRLLQQDARGPRRRRQLLAGMAVSGLTAAAILAVVLTTGGQNTKPPVESATSGAMVRAAFTAFRDDEPQGTSPFEQSGMAARMGFTPVQVQRLDIPDHELWIGYGQRSTGGIDVVCMILVSEPQGATGGSCGPAERLTAGGGLFETTKPAPSSPDADETTVAGLVRDGVRAVTVTVADGRGKTAAVVDNGFVTTVVGRANGVRWRDANGVEHSQQL